MTHDNNNNNNNNNNNTPRIDGRGPYGRRPVPLDLVRGDNRAVVTVKLRAITATLAGGWAKRRIRGRDSQYFAVGFDRVPARHFHHDDDERWVEWKWK